MCAICEFVKKVKLSKEGHKNENFWWFNKKKSHKNEEKKKV